MKKRLIAIAGLTVCLVFLLGPSIGKAVYLRLTPPGEVTKWKTEFLELNSTVPRTEESETQRLALARKLAQRGVGVDGGIRDESIEHNSNPYTFFVMICWSWRELLGIENRVRK